VAEVNGLAGAGIDGAEIGLIEFLRADDVGHDGKDDFVVLDGVVLEPKRYLMMGMELSPGMPFQLSWL